MEIKRVLLLDPPFFRFLNEDQRSVPLGVAYLASSLMARGFPGVVIYNADFDPKQSLSVCNRGYYDEMSRFEAYLAAVTNSGHPIYQEVVSTIAGYQPDLIGISARTAKFFITKTLIRLIREDLGNVPIVVGGPHATANPDHVLKHTGADFVVRGEGEETLVELLQALNQGGSNLGGVKGLSYRQDGQAVHNPPRPLIKDLDTIPFPERERILHRQIMAPSDFSNIFSSRGCPFACSYCDARSTWSRKVRRHSPRYVVEEILDIKRKYGSSFFSFQDDCLVTQEQHTIDLCEEMRRQGLADLPKTEFRWWCEIHPRLVSERLVEKMKEANCVAIAIGAESGSQRTLNAINKSSSPDTIRRAARIIREAGLSLSIFFMIGFPWETEADIQETLDLMEELQPDNPTVSVLTPLPGTPVYEYCRENNLVQYDEDFLTLFHQRSSHFYSERISDEQSAVIIKRSLEQCENLARRRRRERISRFVQERVSSEILAREGIFLEVVGDGSGRRTGKSSGSAAVPRVAVTVDQNYAGERIYVQLQENNNGQAISDSSINRLGRMLLEEFPQYAAVVVQESGGGGAPAHTILSGEISQAQTTEGRLP